MSVMRFFGILCMVLTVAIATLDAASTGRFGGMTVGEFLAVLDYDTMALLRLNLASSADASRLSELLLGLPAALTCVFFGVVCLWISHRRDTINDSAYTFSH